MEHQDRPGWNPPTGEQTLPLTPSTDVPLSAPTVVSSTARRSRIGTGIAVAAVGIGALGIAGTAYATSTTPTPTPSVDSRSSAPGLGTPGDAQRPLGQPDGDARPGGPGGMPGGRHGGGMGMRGGGMGIHGITVVPKQGGGFQTVHNQRGTVTGVSTTSITVKSEDGYTKSYVVTAETVVNAQRDGIASVKTGDEVVVVGIEDGSDVTAVQIMDRTGVSAGMKRLAPPLPAPTSSASTSSSSTA